MDMLVRLNVQGSFSQLPEKLWKILISKMYLTTVLYYLELCTSVENTFTDVNHDLKFHNTPLYNTQCIFTLDFLVK